MTSKLMKHEYLRTRSVILIIWAACAAIALVGSLMVLLNVPGVSALGIFFGVLAIVALLPGTQLYLGIEYWLTSYRRQGYFTQTLPIPGQRIYRAKLLWGALVSVASLVLTLLLAWIMTAVTRTLDTVINTFRTAFQSIPWWMLVMLALVLVTYLFNLLITLYFGASLGSVEPLNRWGIGGPVLVIAAVYFTTQILTVVTTFAIPLAAGMGPDGAQLQTFSLTDLFTVEQANYVPIGSFPVILLLPLVMIWWTARCWKKGASLT